MYTTCAGVDTYSKEKVNSLQEHVMERPVLTYIKMSHNTNIFRQDIHTKFSTTKIEITVQAPVFGTLNSAISNFQT